VQLLQALDALSDTEALAALNSSLALHPTLASLALEEQALLGQSITRASALRGRGGSGRARPSMSPLLLAALDNTRAPRPDARGLPHGESLRDKAHGGRSMAGRQAGQRRNAAERNYRVWGTVVGMTANARRLGDGAALNYSRTRLDGGRRRPWRAERL